MSSPHQSVPPVESSHTADSGPDTGRASEQRIIRIPQLAYLGVLVLLFCVFFFFVGWPVGLWWLLLIPAAAVVWVARTRTVISESGLELRTVFKSRHVDWAELKGVSIPKRGFVRAHLTDGSEVKLPAVSYDRLRDLIAASNGRIPDLFAAAAEAKAQERDASEQAESTTAEPDANAASDKDSTDPEKDSPASDKD